MDALMSSLVHSLEAHPSACDVEIRTLPGAGEAELSAWESRHCALLPADIRQFFLAQNGLQLSWSLRAGQSSYQVGRLSVPELSKLELAPPQEPTQFESPVKMVILDDNPSVGRICLLYRQKGADGGSEESPWDDPAIWILRRGGRLEFLTSSFMNYFRLMVAYAGLEEWPNRVLGQPLSPVAKQWYYIMGKLCLVDD